MDKNTSLDLTNITYELAKTSVEKTTENVQDSSTVVINLIINIIACPFTVLLNVMVIIAVKRRTRLQTNSNILLACLAATDALTGLITQPAFIFWNTFEMTGAINYIPARLTYGTALRVLSMCSCLHLMLVTAERLVAIKFTMHYRHFVTKENIRAAVICSWILSLFCDVLRLIKVIEDRQALAFSLFVVSSCIVFVASGYAVLYVETRRHRKLIKIQQMPQEEAERFRKENKALKTTVYVVSALMLCFLPMALRLVIHLLKRPEIISSLWVRTFAMLNSLLNPLIYCCRQEEMRDFVFKTRTQAMQPH